jgi:hypothetical protein
VLILNVLGPKPSALPKWADDLWQSLAPYYVVDGGRIAEECAPGGYSRNHGSWGGWCGSIKERTYYYGAFHEVRLGSALKHALADGRFNYDLQFDIPVAEYDPASPIVLTLIHTKGLRHDANATLYSVENRTVEGKETPARVPVAQKLDVEFK